jgi:hypothetical protein
LTLLVFMRTTAHPSNTSISHAARAVSFFAHPPPL